jgi:hypothetical protein
MPFATNAFATAVAIAAIVVGGGLILIGTMTPGWKGTTGYYTYREGVEVVRGWLKHLRRDD